MSITAETAMETLHHSADPEKASAIIGRTGTSEALGVSPQTLEDLARSWRQDVGFPERLDLARALWTQPVFEARLMAAKLLTQARISDDAAVWDQICAWISEAETWAELDALASAGARRIAVDLSRMAMVHELAKSERALDRRAALGLSLPLAKLAHPTEDEVNAIDDVLYWLTYALQDPDKDVSRMADSWLKSLGKHDRKRASMVRRVVQSRTKSD
ncbi:DNA alkylation repair protein [Celeribacter sp. PS-C1]|uniref:DNA alkylation repair protein n=1 Tax=Celeribacter sp. PS-C1 TaxID=2820813 RepID=UPI001C67BCA0|nr:DNA alkylation repair protein [Celeribacter sp. PS-C1]MBW6418145.1 DNA alkylation repair protein [Celeribacter sp. PS-C1]